MRKLISVAILAALAGCATAPSDVRVVDRPPLDTRGLERVMGRNAAQLEALFGAPAQDFREDGARKLQWQGQCVLDTYLYPESRGGEPVVAYVDARNAQGDDVDRARCVNALARR